MGISRREIARLTWYDHINRVGRMQVLEGENYLLFFQDNLSRNNKQTRVKRGLFAQVAHYKGYENEEARNVILWDPSEVDLETLDLFNAGRKLCSELEWFDEETRSGVVKKPEGLEYIYPSSDDFDGIEIYLTDIARCGKTLDPGQRLEFWVMEDLKLGPQAVCARLL